MGTIRPCASLTWTVMTETSSPSALMAARSGMSWMAAGSPGGFNLVGGDFPAVFVAARQQRARFVFHLSIPSARFSPSSSGLDSGRSEKVRPPRNCRST